MAENYKVIARKYRPQTFEEVIGQEHITKTISKSIAQKKIAHAYLFSGAHGVGKTSLARIIAKALNCVNGPTDKPCGVCPSCTQIENGTPLDVIEIDGASNRGIENIRTIIENVRISPVAGKYKVYIIDEVHQITNEAFNALLKTLEEPPAHVVFILATTEAERVLPTIRSRCQQYTFKSLGIEDLEKILKGILDKENIKYDEEAIFLIAKQARGSVRDSETILEKMIAYTTDKKYITSADVNAVVGGNNFSFVKGFFDIMIEGDKRKYFEFVKKLFEEAVDPRTFINSIIEYIRVVLMIKSGIDDIKLLEITENERDDLKTFANHYNDDEIERILDYILSVEERIRSASNTRTIFEMRMLLLLNTDNLIRPVDIISSNMQSVSSVSVNEDYGFESVSSNNNAVSNNASAVNQPKPQYDVPLNPNDKRRIFYNKILSFIESESPTIYSLLSQGNPIESKGAVLIVALPDHIYDMTQTDKRINDLVAKAIPHFTKNKDVAIQFQKAVEGNMIDKLKSKLQATEVDESSL
ncbi:DNA polymerase III subunit gamma/tau [Brachyspira hyodysenteriae]|uniref:DNA polymerase III subunit gamma/tau n=1 Tax=Brachyspira hyodysenteriae TaxID=159 RepID=UPI00063DC16D|nr:DNA polymerase III subunit gamma/tau [Brachyspira hyodysenteriae]KLI36217.1 DNA polymerase III subunit gamma/tau [Brachyspira hyodysenteriae]KLI47813.1 DNA polymerase III subunit gamma/tau [Brachyspira hyodysenteriae]KLI51236.1 DNA polymerase III subunit gamma/tau [Brachyspira hyodysenteriae]MCZ9838435.1 DNA polymerase III subunit gamma/tau [Brachyspira hyodysenteriae]MCZ9849548.1 DNA polymerase III subunit gamma/tau [Brachyspira hyodysenteriae]